MNSTTHRLNTRSGGTQPKETHMQSINTQSRNALRSVRRIREAGMTLVEIMIVIVIMALIGTGVTVALLPRLEDANINSTTIDAATIRQAMVLFRAENPGDGCPDMSDLIEGSYLDSSMRTTDAWDADYELECEGREVFAISAGPDGNFGNDDDIQ